MRHDVMLLSVQPPNCVLTSSPGIPFLPSSPSSPFGPWSPYSTSHNPETRILHVRRVWNHTQGKASTIKRVTCSLKYPIRFWNTSFWGYWYLGTASIECTMPTSVNSFKWSMCGISWASSKAVQCVICHRMSEYTDQTVTADGCLCSLPPSMHTLIVIVSH